MGAGHDHSHGSANERGLKIALAVSGTYLVVEVIGAFLTNSLALLSDAAHMLTDVAALVIALMPCACREDLQTRDARLAITALRFWPRW